LAWAWGATFPGDAQPAIISEIARTANEAIPFLTENRTIFSQIDYEPLVVIIFFS
jgi:hypothetical protein